MSTSWEAECYKKWMGEFSNKMSNECKSVIKNINNPTICNASTLGHLRNEIIKSNHTSKKVDELFNNFKLSNKSAQSKKSLENSLQDVFDNAEDLGFGDIENEYSETPTAIAFANICEKMNSIDLEKSPVVAATTVKPKGKKPKKKKEEECIPIKSIKANKSNTLFLQRVCESIGTGDITLRKNKQGEIILEKNNTEIFKSLQPQPLKEVE